MSSIFTKIINREIPAYIVWEDETAIAFLDIKPNNPGHILLVPKKETAYLFDMSDDDYQNILLKAKRLADPLKRATGAKRIGLVVEGFGVDHVHIHLIPINKINELDPNRAIEMDQEELQKIADTIKQEIDKENKLR